MATNSETHDYFTESPYNYTFHGHTIPDHTAGALERYTTHGIDPGGFLISVLANDLFGAIMRADSLNLEEISAIVAWIYWEVPHNAWGSHERVSEWMTLHATSPEPHRASRA